MGIHTPVGADINKVSTTPLFELGTVAISTDGKEYVYVKSGSGGVSGPGYVVNIDEAYVAILLSTSNDARGDLVGVGVIAATVDQYTWVQRKGVANIYVNASCAANTRLNTTSSAGAIDDDGTSGSITVDGIVLTTARGGTAGLAPAMLNYCVQGAVI